MKKSIDFSTYSSIHIGQPENVLIINRGDKIPSESYLVGGANNLLISPTPPPLIMLSKEFAYIKQIDENTLEIGAAMPTGRIISYTKKHNISGFEFCAKLPGTLGGMLAMNAGVKEYEVFNILHSIEIDGKWVHKDDIDHGYRFAKLGGIATAARFEKKSAFNQSLLEVLMKLRDNQPKEPSAGSVFKNPKEDSAGRLIELVGLKGYHDGGMSWSELHANFLVNKGNGTYEEAINLIKLAKKKVFDRFGIVLEEEIKII